MAWSIVSPTGTSASITSSGKLTYPANTGTTPIAWVIKYEYHDGLQNRETTKILTQDVKLASCSIEALPYGQVETSYNVSYTLTGYTIEFVQGVYCKCSIGVSSTDDSGNPSDLHLVSSSNVGEVIINADEIIFGAISGPHTATTDVGIIQVRNDCGEIAEFTIKYHNTMDDNDDARITQYCGSDNETCGQNYWVDLCLPSGNLWAKGDVENSEAKMGDPYQQGRQYCSWGNQEFRISTSEGAFSQDNYNGTSGQTKYNNGTNITQGSSNDVVRAKLGCSWVLPAPDDWQELFENCTVNFDGTTSIVLTSKINGNQIGFRNWGYYIDHDYQLNKPGYWTTERKTNGVTMAILNMPSNGASCDNCQNVLTLETKQPYYGARLRGIVKKP